MERSVLALPNDSVGGTLLRPAISARALVVCIHGGGCHSGYFESGAPSLTQALVADGHAVLLVERPGSSGRRLLDPDRPLQASVEPIRDFLRHTWREEAAGLPLALVGHSIGAALALMLAGEVKDWRPAAVTVSGIGDEPPALVRALADWRGDPLSTQFAELLLGPEGSYDWRGLTRLRKVAAPWNVSERVELLNHWPTLWPDVAARIAVPVQLRLAEAEKIWLTGNDVVRRMADALVAAPAVDAALLPDGGHLYEFHKRGGELIAAQVAFLDRILPRA
jgi:pimeloyl-ACP methyl ester carboxylesterase